MKKSSVVGKPSIHKPEVLMERFPYRYVIVGKIELNGQPDCRIQEYNLSTKRWRDTYLCDNKFHTEALDELLEDDEKFGFIIMDGNGSLYGNTSPNCNDLDAVFNRYAAGQQQRRVA